MKVLVLLFEDFETLDVFGPVEIFGRLKDQYTISFGSINGGLVKNTHGVSILSEPISNMKEGVDIFLIPGGHGTRVEVDNKALIDEVSRVCKLSRFVFTVCTGTALLARTGLLDGKEATSNKKAFDWVTTQGPGVKWIRKPRWVKDEKYYSSGGVSAGMDMALGFLCEQHGVEFARKVANEIEYRWIEDKEEDIFQ